MEEVPQQRTFYANLCGQCLNPIGVTKVGYSTSGPHIEWFFYTKDIPFICDKCEYLICTDCRQNGIICPDDCNGNLSTYSVL